jgi:hypothetical protein
MFNERYLSMHSLAALMLMVLLLLLLLLQELISASNGSKWMVCTLACRYGTQQARTGFRA